MKPIILDLLLISNLSWSEYHFQNLIEIQIASFVVYIAVSLSWLASRINIIPNFSITNIGCESSLRWFLFNILRHIVNDLYRLAYKELKPLNGLDKLCNWIEDRGLKRAAVTNAPKSNAELLITMLGLMDFFETVVLAEECERAKPYPDPYLKGLEALKVSPQHTIVFEVWLINIWYTDLYCLIICWNYMIYLFWL